MKRTLILLYALALLLTGAVSALAAEPGQEQTGQDPTGQTQFLPASVEEYGEGDQLRVKRVYQLSPVDDPEGISTADFERGGYVYHLLDQSRQEITGQHSRPLTKTVTKSSDTDNTEKILKKLDAEMSVTTEDGYSGTLRLDHTSVRVTAAGYASKDKTVTATRTYSNLSDADLSLIPKTITENGKTLTLDDVDWEGAWQTEADGAYVRYSATAKYVGTTSSRYATGYTVTADYTGEVSKSGVEMVTYTLIFGAVREAEPVVEPPQPEIVTEDETGEAQNGEDKENGAENVEKPTESAAVSAQEGESASTKDTDKEKENTGSGTSTEKTERTNQSSEQQGAAEQGADQAPARSAHDYSGLKRTLCSCALLIILAAAAYAVRKHKESKGAIS